MQIINLITTGAIFTIINIEYILTNANALLMRYSFIYLIP